jgi:peptide/nickel transport system ATP-binding protein
MRSLLASLPAGAVKASGDVQVCGQDVFALPERGLREFRRRHLAFVGQDPGASLNPTMRVKSLLREAARHGSGATDLEHALDQVQLPERYLRRRPGELSGGEQRRVALARAIIRGVDILLIDEPLAGLHGPLRRQVFAVLRSLVESNPVAIAVTGHQVNLIRELADEVMTVEASSQVPLLGAAAPTRPRETGPAPARPDVSEDELAVSCERVTASARRVQILHGLDFAAPKGAITAIIGPSGAGKTTLVRVLVGLHPEASGTMRINGMPLAVSAGRRRRVDRGRIQYVPQNPLSTLNPRKTVLATIARPMQRDGRVGRGDIRRRVLDLMKVMELDEDFLNRFPHELSGGQRQRVAVARALAGDPQVLVCDEITSALDARTAKAIMQALEATVRSTGLSLVLISHDIDEVRDHSDFVYVLEGGRAVDSGPTGRVLPDPATAEAP